MEKKQNFRWSMEPAGSSKVRYFMSSTHLFSARLFSERASQSEQEFEAAPSKSRFAKRSECKCYVTSAVVASVCFAEATINEFFATCSDDPDAPSVAGHKEGHPNEAGVYSIGEGAIARIGAFWRLESFDRKATVLEKYQSALLLADKEQFDRGSNPWQDMQLLLHLRNHLVHYKQKEALLGHYHQGTDDAIDPTVKLPNDPFENKFRGKFEESPLYPKRAPGPTAWCESQDPKSIVHYEQDVPFFPDRCLGSGCAKWAFQTAYEFVDEFFRRIGTRWNFHSLVRTGILPKNAVKQRP